MNQEPRLSQRIWESPISDGGRMSTPGLIPPLKEVETRHHKGLTSVC
jgi:hypothetical protein